MAEQCRVNEKAEKLFGAAVGVEEAVVGRLDEQRLADVVEDAPERVQAAAPFLGVAQVLDDQRRQPGPWVTRPGSPSCGLAGVGNRR